MQVKPPFVPQVVLKFRDSVMLPYVDDVGAPIQERKIGAWHELVQMFPGLRTRRLFQAVNPDVFKMLADRAARVDRKLERRNLQTYFIVDCPDSVDPHAVAKALSGWESVEAAYVDTIAKSAQLVCDTSYELAPAFLPTGGINVAGVAGVNGADGMGQSIIDLEHAWNDQHQAFAGRAGILPPLFGENGGTEHGTRVLGILVGHDPAPQGLASFDGIVTNLQSVHVVSSKRVGAMFATLATIPDAILAAIANLQFGNVLLIEEQTFAELPCETDIACFDAISLATALGIVVVEAAGDDGNTVGDLDLYQDSSGDFVLNRSSAQFKDSGAIMVAAAHSASSGAAPFAHAWKSGASNYGSRIDCYAWGENVYTCTSANAADTGSYACFDGTSAAAAIIAGAALSVQGMAENSTAGFRYSPMQLRQILSDPTTGTPGTTKPIGVMPDLAQIASAVLNVVPDVYMRDFVGDLGGADTVTGSSPDIILRDVPALVPQDEFGPTSGTENDYSISVPATQGFDHHVYVRLLNRGGTMLTNVDVDVYYSEPSTLITPSMWTLIGTTTVPMVPTGRSLAVSNELLWPAAQIPARGHYCFLAVANHPQDPGPALPDPHSWDQFVTWVGNNNNVGWRNFDVVSPDLLTDAGDVPLPFFVKGEPNRDRAMELQVSAHLPFGSTLGIELPISLLQQRGLFSRQLRLVDGTENAILPINPNGTSRLLRMTYSAGLRLPTALHVNIPPTFRNHSHDIFARQMYQTKEVGRVTWRLKRTRQQRPAAPTNLHIIS